MPCFSLLKNMICSFKFRKITLVIILGIVRSDRVSIEESRAIRRPK